MINSVQFFQIYQKSKVDLKRVYRIVHHFPISNRILRIVKNHDFYLASTTDPFYGYESLPRDQTDL